MVAAAGTCSIQPIDARWIGEVAVLHREVFAGSMNARLGPGYARALVHWFSNVRDGIALVAIDESNRAVGYALGAPLGYDRRMNRDLLFRAAIGIAQHPWVLFDQNFRTTLRSRARLLLGQKGPSASVTPDLPEPVVSLVGIGVATQAKRTGIASRLLSAFERRTLEIGARSLRLSVRRDNQAAIRCYERNGWLALEGTAELTTTTYFGKVLGDQVENSR